jgi:hypothetical protein
MKFSLKNVKFSEHLSEETNAFTADLYVNNKKVAYAKNSGQGGCTDYHPYPDMRDALKEAETYAITLPDIVVGNPNHSNGSFTIKSNLEHVIDNLFEDWMKQREKKKLQAHMKKGVVCGSEFSYSIITWKGHTIESLLKHPQGKAVLRAKVLELQGKGENILNTNLPF